MQSPTIALLGQAIVNGIFAGAIYGLLGLGLSLSWGLLRQINLSVFAIAFSSGYLTYELNSRGVDPLVALLILPPIFFGVGVALQWGLERFKVASFNSLLITFGLTIIIEAVLQMIWTADVRRVESHYSEYRLRFAELFFPAPEVIALTLSVAVSLALWLVSRRTNIGKGMRAAAEDPAIAAAFGIDQKALALILGGVNAAVASLGGICIALVYSLSPGQIYSWLGVVFACVMLGGLARPLGPLIAGCAIGIVEALTMTVASPSWAPLVSFSLLLIVLLARPGRA